MTAMTLASTSLAAYHSIDMTELEEKVLRAIEGFGPAGCISDQVRDAFPALSYSSVTARFSSLEEKCQIFRAGDTRKGESGRGQQVMRHSKYETTTPKVPLPTKKTRSPFLSGMMRAAKVMVDTDPSLKGSPVAMALKAEILKAARR